MITQSIAIPNTSIWGLPFEVGTGARGSAFEVPRIEVTSISPSSSWKDWLDFRDKTCICESATDNIRETRSDRPVQFTSWLKEVFVSKRIELRSELHRPVSVATTQDQITFILSALSLRVTELASVVDVQRPTIYAWLQGDFSPQAENKSRLRTLFKLASEWRLLSNAPLGKAIRDAQIEGASILDLLKQRKIDETKILKCFNALKGSSELTIKSFKKRGLVASALQRQGVDRSKIRLNNSDITPLSGKRFEED
jgi:hypothetical protein